jgi:hypothetical protein
MPVARGLLALAMRDCSDFSIDVVRSDFALVRSTFSCISAPKSLSETPIRVDANSVGALLRSTCFCRKGLTI